LQNPLPTSSIGSGSLRPEFHHRKLDCESQAVHFAVSPTLRSCPRGGGVPRSAITRTTRALCLGVVYRAGLLSGNWAVQGRSSGYPVAGLLTSACAGTGQGGQGAGEQEIADSRFKKRPSPTSVAGGRNTRDGFRDRGVRGLKGLGGGGIGDCRLRFKIGHRFQDITDCRFPIVVVVITPGSGMRAESAYPASQEWRHSRRRVAQDGRPWFVLRS